MVVLFLCALVLVGLKGVYAGPNDPDPTPIVPVGDLPPGPDFVTSADVGNTPGGLTITPSGEAVYSVSIEVAPGRRGMLASLSLNYNSGGGDGYVGMKWSISGG